MPETNRKIIDESSRLKPDGVNPDSARLLKIISLIGLSILFAYLLIYHYRHEGRDVGHMGDFPTFYQAAQLARSHGDIYTAGPPKQKYVYPPLIAFLYTPLTFLPRLQAAHVMLFVTAATLLGSIALAATNIRRRFGMRQTIPLLFVVFLVSLLNENEMRNELTMLETDGLMLLMFTLALCWLDTFPILAGLALAFAFNIKYLSIVTLPYLILRRRWKTAGAMVAGAAGMDLIPALLFGWKENLRCLTVAFGGLLKWFHIGPANGYAVEVHDIGDTLSLSITTGLARNMGPRGFSDLKIMATAACIGLIALGVVSLMYRLNKFSLWRSPAASLRNSPPFSALTALEWAGLMTVALAFSPDTNTRHLVLAIVTNMVGVLVAFMPRPATSRAPAIVGLVVILLSLIMVPPSLRTQFFKYGIPGWGLLIGYLLILWSGLRNLSKG